MNTITPSHGELQKYRIYFEPVELKASISLLQARFATASIFEGKGIWQGGFELLAVFEIHTTVEEGVVIALAEEIRAINRQASVHITVEPLRVIDVDCKEQKYAHAPDVSYPLV